MSSKGYSHTQIGWIVLIASGLSLLLMAYILTTVESHWIGFVGLVVLAACLVLFSTLTVRGDEQGLEIQFGPGLIRKKFSFKDMESCHEVRNAWYFGWGIRLTPHGWLFNVSGLEALEVCMRNGRRYRIGTDDLANLAQFVRERINPPS